MFRPSAFTRALVAGIFVLVSAEWAPHRLAATKTFPLPAAPDQRQIHLDLDGDGRPDDGRVATSVRVELALSSTRGVRHLFLSEHDRIVGLTAIDVDRDGDLDLVALLESGGVAIWINEGHGDFERASAQRGPPVSLSTSTFASLPLVVGGFITPRTPLPADNTTSAVAILSVADAVPSHDDVVVSTTFDPARPVRAPPASALL